MELLRYTFFQNALLSALVCSILCAMIGTYIVTKRLVFVTGGISHASLGGVGVGALFGFSPLLGATIFALGSAMGIKLLSHKGEIREDSAIAMLWTLGMGVGILCASLAPEFMPDLPAFLFGNLLYVSPSAIYYQVGLTLGVLCFFLCFYRLIVAICFDADFTSTLGVKVSIIEMILFLLTALTLVSCLNMMGIVLAISLLSVPQTTANLFTKSFSTTILLSILFSVFSTIIGLYLSFLFNLPTGVTIVLTAILLYFFCLLLKNIFIQ